MKSLPLFLLAALLLPVPRLAAFEKDLVTAVARDTAIDLHGEWRYKVVPQVQDSLFAPDLDDSSWAVASAPGRWTDQGIPHDELTVVVYRKTVRVPAEWKGRAIGISAWFYPGISNVRVNGQPVDPEGPLPAMYAEVSALLRYGEDNTIAVATTGDGVRELAETDPPLLGPLGQKSLTRVVRKDVVIPAPGRPMAANLFFPDGGAALPIIIFAATGHVDYPLKDDWQSLNEDLARLGYASLAVAFNRFLPAEYEVVLQYLKGLPEVDSSRIALVGAMRATPFAVHAALGSPQVRALVLVSSAKVPEIDQLKDRPVLFLCSRQERFAPTAAIAGRMAEQLTGPHQVVVLPGISSGVNVLDTDWNQTREAMLEWLRQYLPAGGATH